FPFNDLLYSCLDSADQTASPSCAFFLGADGVAGTNDGTGRLPGLEIFPDDAEAPISNLGLLETDGVDFEVAYD
ncbi:MAG: hypothetical protein GWO04_16140, partial [Actinobacteria bacterium]|nr:hypothetical protein [Actinomycetota bacterium]